METAPLSSWDPQTCYWRTPWEQGSGWFTAASRSPCELSSFLFYAFNNPPPDGFPVTPTTRHHSNQQATLTVGRTRKPTPVTSAPSREVCDPWTNQGVPRHLPYPKVFSESSTPTSQPRGPQDQKDLPGRHQKIWQVTSRREDCSIGHRGLRLVSRLCLSPSASSPTRPQPRDKEGPGDRLPGPALPRVHTPSRPFHRPRPPLR